MFVKKLLTLKSLVITKIEMYSTTIDKKNWVSYLPLKLEMGFTIIIGFSLKVKGQKQ